MGDTQDSCQSPYCCPVVHGDHLDSSKDVIAEIFGGPPLHRYNFDTRCHVDIILDIIHVVGFPEIADSRRPLAKELAGFFHSPTF